jgi:hypothetical protein
VDENTPPDTVVDFGPMTRTETLDEVPQSPATVGWYVQWHAKDYSLPAVSIGVYLGFTLWYLCIALLCYTDLFPSDTKSWIMWPNFILYVIVSMLKFIKFERVVRKRMTATEKCTEPEYTDLRPFSIKTGKFYISQPQWMRFVYEHSMVSTISFPFLRKFTWETKLPVQMPEATNNLCCSTEMLAQVNTHTNFTADMSDDVAIERINFTLSKMNCVNTDRYDFMDPSRVRLNTTQVTALIAYGLHKQLQDRIRDLDFPRSPVTNL